MQRRARAWGVIAALGWLLADAAISTRAAADVLDDARQKHVLLLYPESRLLPANVILDQAIRAALQARLSEPVYFYTEYLDLSLFEGDEPQRELRDLLRRKYARRPIDLIIPVDSRSLRIALRNRADLFAGAPIVFGAVDPTAAAALALPPDVTGTWLVLDWAGTLEAALRLQPGTRLAVVLGGSSPGVDRVWLSAARRQLAAFQGRVEVTYLTDRSLEDVLKAVAALPARTVLLVGAFQRDATGRNFLTRDVVARIAAASSVPVYGLSETLVGAGIVGGRVIGFEAMGVQTAELAARVLRGGPPAPPGDGPTLHAYDWRQLQRWGLDEGRLPPGSAVRFRPPSAWELYRWFIVGGTTLVALQSALIAALLVHRSRRRRAERALAESEERFRRMADSAPIMVWLSDADGRRTYVNARWLALTGRRLEDELGEGWVARVHPDDREACVKPVREALAAREPFTVEYRLGDAGGAYRWVLDHGVPRVDDAGAFAGHVGSAIDVTELKTAQQGLAESHALRSAVFGSLYGRVAAIDRDGVVLAVNRSWSRLATEHASASDAVGVGANYLVACRAAVAGGEPDAARALEAILSVLEGRADHASLEYARPGPPEARWFEMTVEAFRRPEGGAVIVHVDITRRHQAEDEARRQREELAHVLRVTTLGELAASLAHEVNQPLTAILANAQAARRAVDEGAPGGVEARGALGDIADDARRAGEIIRRMLALARKQVAERRPLDVNALIAEVVRLLRADVHRRHIAVRLARGERLAPVIGDRVLLQQVVLNAVVNACDAIDAGTGGTRRITVETRAPAPGWVEIAVSDTGIGLPADALETIFEPFSSNKPGGLGMGLTISRSIVQAHGGRIWARGHADGGLVLHVVLPTADDGSQA